MKKQLLFSFGICLSILLPSIVFGQSTSEIKHSFFIAGPQFTGIIGASGEEIWNSGKSGARDGYNLNVV